MSDLLIKKKTYTQEQLNEIKEIETILGHSIKKEERDLEEYCKAMWNFRYNYVNDVVYAENCEDDELVFDKNRENYILYFRLFKQQCKKEYSILFNNNADSILNNDDMKKLFIQLDKSTWVEATSNVYEPIDISNDDTLSKIEEQYKEETPNIISYGVIKSNLIKKRIKILSNQHKNKINIISMPLWLSHKNTITVFNNLLQQSEIKPKIPIAMRMHLPADSNHYMTVMFYNNKVIIIDSGGFFKYSHIYMSNKDYFDGLEEENKLIYVNKKLQKMGYDYIHGQDNLKQYNTSLDLGNCYFLSSINMEVLVNKIAKINNYIEQFKELKNKVDFLQNKLVKYSFNDSINKSINDISNIDNSKVNDIDYLKEQVISAYIKSTYFENDVHKIVNKIMSKAGINKNTNLRGKEGYGKYQKENYYNINDKRYILYTLKVYDINKKNTIKTIETFDNEKQLELRKKELLRHNEQLFLKMEIVNTYITNINKNLFNTMKYKKVNNKYNLNKYSSEQDMEPVTSLYNNTYSLDLSNENNELTLFTMPKNNEDLNKVVDSIKSESIKIQKTYINKFLFKANNNGVDILQKNNNIKRVVRDIRDIAVLQAINDTLEKKIKDLRDIIIDNERNDNDNRIQDLNSLTATLMDTVYKDKDLNYHNKYICHTSTWYAPFRSNIYKITQRLNNFRTALNEAKSRLKTKLAEIKIGNDQNLSKHYEDIIGCLDEQQKNKNNVVNNINTYSKKN